jgi:hypothetical protein
MQPKVYKVQASLLIEQLSLFLELKEDCCLLVKVYPKSTPGVLTFPTAFFPKNILDYMFCFTDIDRSSVVLQAIIKSKKYQFKNGWKILI